MIWHLLIGGPSRKSPLCGKKCDAQSNKAISDKILVVLGNNFRMSRNRSPMQSFPQSPLRSQDDQIRLVTALGLISSTTHWQEHGPPLEDYHQVKAVVDGNLSCCGKHAGRHLKPHAGRVKG